MAPYCTASPVPNIAPACGRALTGHSLLRNHVANDRSQGDPDSRSENRNGLFGVESTADSPLYGTPLNFRSWPFTEIHERPLI
jgi:hypothetical protein